jgi:DNA-binding transcriptional ArsR family regulator
MAIVMRLAEDAPLRCRFAVSPVHETTDAVRALTHPGRETYHLPWQRQTSALLAGLDLGALLALTAPGGYQPDFLTPPPVGPFTEIETELAQVRGTPVDVVTSELRRWRHGHPQAARLLRSNSVLDGDAAALRDLLADQLSRAWTHLVAPWWPKLREVLDADITARARQLADVGTVATLNELHPKVSYRNGEVRVAIRATDHRALTHDGIVLIPSAFAWPDVGVMQDPPWQAAIIYPARGISRLWQPSPQAAVDLSRLLGATRAAILIAAGDPASTTGLAARCRLPVSTVSEHLGVLRANGLITTARAGRYLIHQQTALGTAIAGRPTDRD